jgi:hypothetical protein
MPMQIIRNDITKMSVDAKYFIENGNYNIFEINEVLFKHGKDRLGA